MPASRNSTSLTFQEFHDVRDSILERTNLHVAIPAEWHDFHEFHATFAWLFAFHASKGQDSSPRRHGNIRVPQFVFDIPPKWTITTLPTCAKPDRGSLHKGVDKPPDAMFVAGRVPKVLGHVAA